MIFKKESLERLREKIDLVEVLSAYIHFSKSGAVYKAHCPFHEEKTPSFMVKRGDSHYHCFGCGAHGDAIQFLMMHQKMSFLDSVEYLASKFQVILETTEKEEKGPNKNDLKNIMNEAARFYHFYLLNTNEGHSALSYLYQRGIDLDFIQTFQIGFAPRALGIFLRYMQQKKFPAELLKEVGLIRKNGSEFFFDRILFPIKDARGSVIGFSGRKLREETFGGKYINTPETPLFKKSKVLFGLHYSRANIAREKKAIIVEGQIDALRLIYEGFSITVAGQGTSFTEDHVKELISLGVEKVYLALDADSAGMEAAVKIGNLFQKKAIEVFVLILEKGKDPDLILREKGPEDWKRLLKESFPYLDFLVKKAEKEIDIYSPSGKAQFIEKIIKQIKNWENPILIHESLKKVAKLTKTPEEILIKPEKNNVFIQKKGSLTDKKIDPDLVLEMDLLRWIFFKPEWMDTIALYIHEEDFILFTSKRLFAKLKNCIQENKKIDLFTLGMDLQNSEDHLFLSQMLQKKINLEKSEENLKETLQKILDRNWLLKREEIRIKLQSQRFSEEEKLSFAKEFDVLKKSRILVENLFSN